MDSELADWQEKFKSQVFSVCSALGGFEQISSAGPSPAKASPSPTPTITTSGALQYVLGDECLDCLKDLKRYIRQDETNPAKHVLGWLGEWSILQRDLLPLLEVTAARLLADNSAHADDLAQRYSDRMAAVCISALELLVVMTWYVDKEERSEALWFDRVLCSYKLAFATHPTIIATLLQLLVQALAIPTGDRSARDRLIINGVLLIYRNLLEIPDPHVSITASGELITHGKLQEMLIETFQRGDIYDLVLTFASSADERELQPYNLIIHDILYFSFKDVRPEELFKDASQHATRITDRLLAEKRQAKLDRSQASISRHSRFGGTYAVQSPTGQVMTMLTSQTFTQPLDHTMDGKKTKNKRVKAPKVEAYENLRHPFQDHQTFAILANVAKAYLESGFNTLAASVREDIERERAKVKAQDVTRFMYTTAFFMQALLLLVNHQDGITPQLALMEQPFAATVAVSEPTADTFGFELVGSMVNLPAFALVVRSLRTFYEEKRWAEMHTSVRCFLHLLKTLIRMSNSATEAHREVADHMFQNLCYEAATLDLLGTLVRQGDSHAYDQTYLGDLVELMHLFLRVLEHYAQEKQHMFVRKKQRVPRFTKPPGEDSNESIPQGATHSDADVSDAAASGEDSSARYSFVEREFELAQCERDLARESVIKTYSTLLKQYRELPSMAVYWIVTMFQRLAIKQGFEGLFFKLSTLELFHNILTDQRRLKVYAQVDRELSAQAGLVPWDLGASTTTAGPRQVSPWTALCEFIEYIVKQFFAHLSTEPILFMEVLFSRTRLECLRPDLQQATKSKTSRPSATSAVASGSEEASDDFDNLMATRQFDFTALHCHEEEHGELTVSSHLPWSHKLGAVIGILLYRQLGATVQWVKQALAEAKAQRDQQVPNEPSSLAPLATIPDYVLPRSSVHYSALKYHSQLAELLRLVGFHYIPSIEPSDQPDDGVSTGAWALITAVPVADLDLNIRTIDEHLTGPLGPDGTPLPRVRPSKASKKKAPRRVRRRPDATSSGSDGKDDTPQARKTRPSRPRKGKTKHQLLSRAQSGQASDDKPGGGDTESVSRMETSQALWSNNRSKASSSLARKVSALALSTSPDTSEVEAALESSEDPLNSDGETTAQPRRPSPPIDSQSLAASNPIPNHSADMPTLSPPTKRIRRLKNRHFQENDTIWSSSPRDALPSDPDALLANSHRLTDAGYSLPQTDWVPTSAAVDGAGSLPQSAPSDDRNSEIDPDEAIDGLDTKAAPTISVARARNVYQSRRRTMGIVSDSE